jgi:tetratricopeptide (TPR) repeat protein
MNRFLKQTGIRTGFTLLLLAILVPAAFAKDEWLSIRTDNFYLIGNTKEKELRAVAAKLEQFRETFKLIFPRAKFDQSIDTNVIVFKDDRAYRPFKPKRNDGKADDWIAGYFQSGEDVNYITLSTEGPREETFGTIFHEYVHFLIDSHFGKSQVPPWFNEGLAEYYQTFKIENDQKVFLGEIQEGHLRLLQRTRLIPFEQFFNITNYALHQNAAHSRSIFYAQAWALVHYLVQGGQIENLSKFLTLVLDDKEPETAFKQAFGMGYADMENELGKYVRQNKFSVRWIEFKKKLDFEETFTVESLSDADANAYLGDLLYHTREYDDAETYLKSSLTEDPDQTLANTAYGLVLMRRGKFDEAKSYLERAVASNRKNHFAQYSYAYVLSRETMDEFGYVSKIPHETARKMREALQASIDAKPSFVPSYRLMAFINLVNNENLDEALGYLNRGLAVLPGELDLSLMVAKIKLRQEKFDEAEKIAERVSRTADTEATRKEAQQVMDTVEQFRDSLAKIRKNVAAATGSKGAPILKKRSELSSEDIALVNQENLINRLHLELPKIRPGEKRVIGRLESLECVEGAPRYTVRTEKGVLNLESEDFAGLFLLTLDEKADAVEVGCDSDLSAIKIVFGYKPADPSRTASDGTLLSMTFVPEFFRLKTPQEIADTRPVVIVDDEQTSGREVDLEKARRETMLDNLKKSLRKPQPGELRILGTLRKIECGRKYASYLIESGGKTYTLRNDPSAALRIVTFTRDLDGAEFRCGSGPYAAHAVITYRPANEKKLDGNIIALEFVPDAFRLE